MIDLPPTGFVVFTGANSNGKSVIVRTLMDMLSDRISKPRARAALVNRKATFGEIEFTRSDDTVLLLHLSRSANLTYISYSEAGKEAIIRYLSDKSYKELINRFGWHYDKELGLSLNIAQAEDPLLFYKTRYKTNGAVLRTATSDSSADKVAEKFTELLKDTKSFRDNCVKEITTINTVLSGLVVEDAAPLLDLKGKLEWCLRNLGEIKFPELPDIKPVPNVSVICIQYPTIPEIQPVPEVTYVDVYYPTIPNISYPTILDIRIEIPDICNIASELKDLYERRCPTCGRRFSDEIG